MATRAARSDDMMDVSIRYRRELAESRDRLKCQVYYHIISHETVSEQRRPHLQVKTPCISTHLPPGPSRAMEILFEEIENHDLVEMLKDEKRQKNAGVPQ
jgi:hypothetical protein